MASGRMNRWMDVQSGGRKMERTEHADETDGRMGRPNRRTGEIYTGCMDENENNGQMDGLRTDGLSAETKEDMNSNGIERRRKRRPQSFINRRITVSAKPYNHVSKTVMEI